MSLKRNLYSFQSFRQKISFSDILEKMSEPRICSGVCPPDYSNNSNVFINHFSSFNFGPTDVLLNFFHLALVIWFIMPLLFRYSLWIRRNILFAHATGISIFLRSDYFKPETHGIPGARNFYLMSNNSENIKLGIWHILPKSLVKYTELIPSESEYWEETLRSSGKPIILYFHGSIGTRGTCFRIELYKLLQEEEYHVIAFDYRGFGDSTSGLPSESGSVADGRFVFNWLRDILGKESKVPVFFWGHSIGTGVSCHLTAALGSEAENNNSILPLGLILEAPFNNFQDEIRLHPASYFYNFCPLVFEWCFIDPVEKSDVSFESDRHILNVKIPILILHAVNDFIVPYKLGRKLYEIAAKSRSSRAHPVHLIAFKGFNFYTSHSYICRSPKLPGILKTFKNACLRVSQ